MKKRPRISYRDLAKERPENPSPVETPALEVAGNVSELPTQHAATDALETSAGTVEATELTLSGALGLPSSVLEPSEPVAVDTFVERNAPEVALDDPACEHLVFRIGAELFALPLNAVDETLDVADVHRLPEMDQTMLGVFTLRGTLLPLYSPVTPLGVPLETGSAALVFTRPRGRVALAVDDVDDVLPIRPSQLRRAPVDTSDGVLVGVVRRGVDLIGVLDATALVIACRAEPVLEIA